MEIITTVYVVPCWHSQETKAELVVFSICVRIRLAGCLQLKVYTG